MPLRVCPLPCLPLPSATRPLQDAARPFPLSLHTLQFPKPPTTLSPIPPRRSLPHHCLPCGLVLPVRILVQDDNRQLPVQRTSPGALAAPKPRRAGDSKLAHTPLVD